MLGTKYLLKDNRAEFLSETCKIEASPQYYKETLFDYLMLYENFSKDHLCLQVFFIV